MTARQRRLDLKQRLALHLEVCAAVQHGHQRGVIHRDLKPGNILVGGDGRPKVIDFGIAKAQDAGMPTTLATDLRQLVGTLQYMSPEQLRGDPAEIDIRTDVYSLGLILYELLADQRPYDLGCLSLPEAVLRLQKVDPPPLSAVRRELRGDMSTIVAKAIEKERARRYQSVSELSADLERFLRSEPIVARPASAAYLLRKFARRNRALAAAGIISAGALVTGAALAGWKAIEATRERNAAFAASRRAERINTFLMRVLAAGDPRDSGADVTIRQALGRAADSISVDFAGDDRVAGDVHYLIGSIFERMGEHDRAETHLSAAVAARRRAGETGSAIGEGLRDLAWAVASRDAVEAERLFEEAADVFRASCGPQSIDAVQMRVSIGMLRINQKRYAEAESMIRAALIELEKSGSGKGRVTLLAHRSLAIALCRQHKPLEAEPHYLEAVSLARRVLGNEHLDTAVALKAYAAFLENQGRTDEATALHAEADQIRKKLLGPAGDSHP